MTRAYVQSLVDRIEVAGRVASSFELPRQKALYEAAALRFEILRNEARVLYSCLVEEQETTLREIEKNLQALREVLR